MENGSSSTQANGFRTMSQNAETGSGGGERENDNTSGIASNLKSYGVDTNQMTEAANERVSELQKLIADEIRTRPMRALGWAAAAGVIFGFWAAK